jgi:hypothetical protein
MGHLVGARVETLGGRGRVEGFETERWWSFGRPHYTVWFHVALDSGRYVLLTRERFEVASDE